MIKKFLFGLLVIILFVVGYFSIGSPPRAKEISWGVNFSQKYAELLGLDWKETYFALLDELGVKNLRVAAHWDLIEPQKGEYYFKDLDWKIQAASEKGAKVILAIGMKTPRWPECHIPEWAMGLSKEKQQERILKLLNEIVLRYRERVSVRAWQVENEPLFPFGECPWIDKDFLKKEINLVKSLDPNRPIIITDSGEFSFWITAASLGDIVGTTLHRRVWSKELGVYITHYWFRPIFYWRKAQIIKKLFGKEVICVELQAEPWGPKENPYLSLEEQKKTMNLEKFKENIEFARKTGLDTFYLWGAEWWYWLRETKNKPEIWNEAGKLFN